MSNIKVPHDPGDIPMFTYECELKDNQHRPPHQFCAVSDEQAIGMMEKMYEPHHWILFRKDKDRRVPVHEA